MGLCCMSLGGATLLPTRHTCFDVVAAVHPFWICLGWGHQRLGFYMIMSVAYQRHSVYVSRLSYGKGAIRICEAVMSLAHTQVCLSVCLSVCPSVRPHVCMCIRLCRSVYVCMQHLCLYAYIHTYLHTYMHTYIHTYRQTHRQTDARHYIHIYICTNTCVYRVCFTERLQKAIREGAPL